MKATIRHRHPIHTDDLPRIWAESMVAALVLALSFAATGVALMFLVGSVRF